MPGRKRKKQGVPANTNPFCINVDVNIDDAFWTSVSAAKPYFDWIGDDCRDHTPLKVKAPALSQKEVEKLVSDLFQADVVISSFAVKERFAHIIPRDLRDKVLLTRSPGPTCVTKDCYKSGDKFCKNCKRRL